MYKCFQCPRNCGVDRTKKLGFCKMPMQAVLARSELHFWEEPCISGEKGSGAVFFSGCSLKCVYCQNQKTSHDNFGERVTVENLKRMIFNLIDAGANNINFVNPTHYAHILIKLLSENDFGVPIIYNSSGYESVETLKKLNGLIDVYLPDLKYVDENVSDKYSSAPDYFAFASKAILEMYNQVGSVVLDERGIIEKGLIVRHLVLPSNTKQAIKVLEWLKENFGGDVWISLMCQYVPFAKSKEYNEINRKITLREYKKVVTYMESLNFENGYIQDIASASGEYIPDFSLQGVITDSF